MDREKQNSALVVDDDAGVRELVTELLAEDGFEIDAVTNGEEALERLRSREYEIILLDLMMPVKDGFDVLRELGIEQPAAARRVIVMTGGDDQTIKRVDREAVCGVIRKPFRVAEFRTYVRQCHTDLQKLEDYLGGSQ